MIIRHTETYKNKLYPFNIRQYFNNCAIVFLSSVEQQCTLGRALASGGSVNFSNIVVDGGVEVGVSLLKQVLSNKY